MGNAESHEVDEFDRFEGIDTLGYRVLGVQPDSPASQAGLVSFFDFVVGANNKILMASGEGLEEGEEYDDVDFPALCLEFLNKPLELLVWNIKCQEKRLVTITPSDSWGGAGLLGVTIRLDDYGGADERLIRVLQVEDNSPAAIAGLRENHDYLLGTAADSFDSTQTLAQVLHAHVDRVVELYVYNTESDVVRVVALMPTWSWGGQGLLGAEVGTGYLHRLPQASRHTTGSSVERKVRWVGMKPPHPAAAAAASTEANAAAKEEPTLEMEPQLEMEVVDSEAPSHDHHKTIQQVTSGNAAVSEVAQSQATSDAAKEEASTATGREVRSEGSQEEPVATIAVQTTQQVSEAPAKASAESQSPEPMEASAAQTAKHPDTTASQQTPDAASFFAGPPPGAAPYASQFMPPPPMSHLAQQS